jgi:hypothetical protein
VIPELLEHGVIGARLQFVLRVANYGSRIAQGRNAVRTFAAIPRQANEIPLRFAYFCT